MTLCVLAGLAAAQGIRPKRFAFVAYGILYAYAGICIQVLRDARRDSGVFAYFTVSGVLVLAGLIMLARRFGSEE